jgi:hypothetical protein
MYVIVLTDRTHKGRTLYVAEQGSPSSYTTRLDQARTFLHRASALVDLCPENERVVSLDSIMAGGAQ